MSRSWLGRGALVRALQWSHLGCRAVNRCAHDVKTRIHTLDKTGSSRGHLSLAGGTAPVRLLYSSRSYEEIIYRKELESLQARDGSLEVIHTLTRSNPTAWSGYHRRIDAQMLAEVAWPPDESPLAFVCGPTLLVEAVGGALVGLGHGPARVKTERFGATGG